MSKSSVSRSTAISHNQSLFESLEQRLLLAADWAGAWSINGYLNEADTGNNTASISFTTLVAGTTIQNLGGGNYQMNVPSKGKSFALQASGDELVGYTAGLDSDHQYQEQYIRVIPIDDNAALFFLGNGGFDDASKGPLRWSSGAMGLITRGSVAITPRPWVGQYSYSGYTVESDGSNGTNAGSVTLSPGTGTINVTALPGGQYLGEMVGEGTATFVTSGKGLLSAKSGPEGGGGVDQEQIRVFRGPDDTAYVLESNASFDTNHTVLNNAQHSVYVLTPNAGFEYKPDLTAEIIGTAGDVLPGQTVTVSVKITNSGGAPASGKIGIDLTTPISATGPTTSKTQAIKLNSGASMVVPMTFTVPATATPGSWDISASVDTGNVIAELDETNNSAAGDAFCNVVWAFGQVAGKAGRKLTIPYSVSSAVTFAMTGPGTGTVTNAGGLWQVTLSGNTTAATSITITSAFGRTVLLSSVVAPAPVKSISAATSQLVGPMTLTGVNAAGVTIALADVSGGSINSASPIKSFSAGQWIDTADDFITDLTAPSMAKITIAGDFQGDVTLAAALGASSVAGNLAGSLWDVSGSITKMTVAGDVGQSIVRSGLDIASLTLGSSTGSDFGAGVSSALLQASRHVAVGDAANTPTGTIKSFTIKGRKGAAATVPFFEDSNISAGIGTVSLVNWDLPGGLYAPAGKIGKIINKDLTIPGNSWTYPPPRGVVNAGPGLFIHVV